MAFVCTPTHLHINTIKKIHKFTTCHFYLEKPFSSSIKGCAETLKIIKNNKKKIAVGYMLVNHPLMKKAQQIIKSKIIGRNIFARVECGFYLPNWHPWEDYRKTYAAIRNMGGGPALTLSHEIDLAIWFFGEVNKVVSMTNYNSNLEIDTEHSMDILLSFQNGITGNIHLDYLHKPAKRSFDVLGTSGRVEFDYYSNTVTLYTHNDLNSEVYSVDDKFDRNDMFISEIKEFVDAVSFGKLSPISLKESFMSVDVALRSLSG